MTKRLKGTDVVLIGIGAANGVSAQVLTQAGLEVIALEAGPRLTASAFTLDEIRNDIRNWDGQPKAAGEVPTWRPNSSVAAGPPPTPALMTNAVGGTSIHYGTESKRYSAYVFRERSRVIAAQGKGAIPAGSTLVDWPLGYGDLEPYYDHVEYAIGVSGQAGNLRGRRDPRGNPFEEPRRRGYPMPPVRGSGWTALMDKAAKQLGWHPFPPPAGILTEPYNDLPACTYCGFCVSTGCYIDAKSSTYLNVIPAAEKTGRLRIVTRARVTRIESDANGRVTGVTYVHHGRQHFQPARAVLLGGYVYENTRLLLLSATPSYPRGLSNNHGQVGRHFMSHLYILSWGFFPGIDLNVMNGLNQQAIAIDDWSDDNFDHSRHGFIGGGSLLASQEVKPIAASKAYPPANGPAWGSEWKNWILNYARQVNGTFSQSECLPYESNFLDLDPVKKDPYGIPVVRVTFSLGRNEVALGKFIAEKNAAWLQAAGADPTQIWGPGPFPIPVNTHAYGGTRMGLDPNASVVDAFGFSHEAPNLGVVGGSTYPTAGSNAPTLTMQALAWRTAEHLAQNWNSIAG